MRAGLSRVTGQLWVAAIRQSRTCTILSQQFVLAPPAILGAAEEHFRRVRLAPADRAVPDLEAYVRAHLGLEPWRTASRAASVSRALPDPRAVPLLIDAREIWSEQALAGKRVARLQFDISREEFMLVLLLPGMARARTSLERREIDHSTRVLGMGVRSALLLDPPGRNRIEPHT